MSAPLTDHSSSSVSSSGYVDGLGRRTIAFDRETGEMLERLILRPELAVFEQALRERVDHLASLEDERFARPYRIERDAQTGELTVLSEFVAGSRLADLLDASHDEALVAGVDVALGYVLESLPALSTLHMISGITHGVIDPARTVLTPAGQVVFLDAAFGETVQRLGLSRMRLWNDFGVAAPPGTGPVQLDATADIAQVALSAIMLVLGRPLFPDEYPDSLPSLLMEVVEVAQIRGSMGFAGGLQRILQRSLPLPGRRPYTTADEAVVDVRQLVRREIGLDVCRQALIDFVQQVDTAGATARDADADVEQDDQYDDEESAEEPPREERAAAPTQSRGIASMKVLDDFLDRVSHESSRSAPIVEEESIAEAETIEPAAPSAEAYRAVDEDLDDEDDDAMEISLDGLDAGRDFEPEHVYDLSAMDLVESESTSELPPSEPEAEPYRELDAPPAVEEPPFIAAEPLLPETYAPEPVNAPAYTPRRRRGARATASGTDRGARAGHAGGTGDGSGDVRTCRTCDVPGGRFTSTSPGIARRRRQRVLAPPEAPAPKIRARTKGQAALDGNAAAKTRTAAAGCQGTCTAGVTERLVDFAKSGRGVRPSGPRTGASDANATGAGATGTAGSGRATHTSVAVVRADGTGRVSVCAAAVDSDAGVWGAAAAETDTRAAAGHASLTAGDSTGQPTGACAQAEVGAASRLYASDQEDPRRTRAQPTGARESPHLSGHAAGGRRTPWVSLEAGGRGYRPRPGGYCHWPGVSPRPSGCRRRTGRACRDNARSGSAAPAPAPEKEVPLAADKARLVIQTQPAGIKVLLDRRLVGQTPLNLDVTPGKHVLSFMTSGGEVMHSVRAVAGKTLRMDIPVFSGWVAVFAPIILDIAESGQSIGNTEQNRLMLPPGRHELTFSNRDLAYSTTQVVNISPGEVSTVTLEPKGPVNLNAVPWAEVWLDGQKLGETPLANAQVPLGLREFIFKHPQHGERRVTATIRANAPAAATVDFTR